MSNLHPDPPTFKTHIGIWDSDGCAIFMRGPSGRSDLRSYPAIVLPLAEYERLLAAAEDKP